MTSWLAQRDITDRLIANRHERYNRCDNGQAAFECLMSQLPEYMVRAICDELSGQEMITQTRIEDWDV